jgi:hypothetical protein
MFNLKTQLKKAVAATLAIGSLLGATPTAKADEGMWLLMMVSRLNHADMKKMGLKLSAEELYSVNKSSLKDAIGGLNFGNPQGNFCTSELISDKGLLLTNHHCAYDAIQSHSTPENNRLRDGFWAKSFSEELPIKDVAVSFLVRMDEVTQRILGAESVKNATDEATRNKAISEEIKKIVEEEKEKNKKAGVEHYDVYVKDFFKGNDYYIFVTETFKDVRLVGNPAEAIGKFGGDTDNWMWPRHTGDFSFLRVYADKNNKPAPYSADNVPYKPKHFLPVSLKGIKPNDFSMVMGYPGRTDRYRASYGIQLDMEETNPHRIALRDTRLKTWKSDMVTSEAINIKYASKYASIANYWKYFIGQNEGLKRLKTLDYKRSIEQKFQEWANKGSNDAYKNALPELEKGYNDLRKVNMVNNYRGECVMGVEFIALGMNFYQMKKMMANPQAAAMLPKVKEQMKEQLKDHFKDYNAATDQKVFAAMMEMYYKNVPREQQPEILGQIVAKYGTYGTEFKQFAEEVFQKSFLVSEEKLNKFLENPDEKTLNEDIGYQVVEAFEKKYETEFRPKVMAANEAIDKAMRNLVAGMREMQQGAKFYPDANSTLRLSFGKVIDYKAKDAVRYDYKTTAKGILEKEDATNPEFVVPKYQSEAINKKDFGRYAEADGSLTVAFLTDNDITGGNSGSPVINANGELIGTAFDGNWEAMTGDLVYDKELKRCINVDIRYTLWVVEKLYGATNLINELKFVK